MKFPSLKALALILGLSSSALPDARGELPGTYQTTWVGNTFEGAGPSAKGRWVQNMIASTAVTPDGTVIAASVWDEAGRCIGLYREGQPNEKLLQQYNGRGGHQAWGWGTAGEAVAATDEHIFLVNTQGELLRFRWSPPDINSATYVDQVQAGKTRAMDARGDLLVLAREDAVVEIRSLADLGVRGSFPAKEVRGIAVDPSGKSVWLIQENQIVQRTLDGTELPGRVPGVDQPSALAFAPDGRLLVCDDGPSQQVLIYEMQDPPRLVRRVGQSGGLRAGTPGIIKPDKLYGLRGAGLDRDGNLYVALCLNVQGAGTAIRSFDPQGNLRWQLESHAFGDVYGFDPESDGTVLYGMDEIIDFDPQAAPGEGWRARAITLDAIAHPEDLRLKERMGAAFLRNLEGRRLLYTIPQQANRIELFAFEEAPSQIARHVGRPIEGGWALHVDARGDIWRGDAPEGQIQRHRFRHWSDEGKPVFGLEKADSFSRPEHFTEIARVLYVPETDTMYLSGFTKDKPAPSWGLMGAILERYDDWTSGAPKRRWSIDLPVDDDKLPPKSFDVAGDYVFTVQVKPTRDVPAKVNVYRASDGGHAGFMRPGPEVGGNSGWVDMTHGLQAMQRKDGTYLVIVQENARAKNLVYRWQPPTSSAPSHR